VVGWVPAELLSASAVLPFSVLGGTLLTTGLLRAQRRAALALAEREQAQALLRATNDSLEHQVALRTAELRETIDGLESFNRSVSHDLRAPLGGIVGITRLTRQKLDAGDQAQALRLLDLIEGQAGTSVKLVEALLALSRASDATLHLRDVDSGQLVADVIMALPQEVARQCKVEGLMPTVRCDPELMRQVFANLIGNAVKFANRAQQPQVEVSACGEAQQRRLEAGRVSRGEELLGVRARPACAAHLGRYVEVDVEATVACAGMAFAATGRRCFCGIEDYEVSAHRSLSFRWTSPRIPSAPRRVFAASIQLHYPPAAMRGPGISNRQDGRWPWPPA